MLGFIAARGHALVTLDDFKVLLVLAFEYEEPSEEKSMFEAFFDLVDEDGSGTLAYGELANWFKSLGLPVNTNNVGNLLYARFGEFKPFLTKDEFVDWMTFFANHDANVHKPQHQKVSGANVKKRKYSRGVKSLRDDAKVCEFDEDDLYDESSGGEDVGFRFRKKRQSAGKKLLDMDVLMKLKAHTSKRRQELKQARRKVSAKTKSDKKKIDGEDAPLDADARAKLLNSTGITDLKAPSAALLDNDKNASSDSEALSLAGDDSARHRRV